jgi:hypothetical protein
VAPGAEYWNTNQYCDDQPDEYLHQREQEERSTDEERNRVTEWPFETLVSSRDINRLRRSISIAGGGEHR